MISNIARKLTELVAADLVMAGGLDVGSSLCDRFTLWSHNAALAFGAVFAALFWSDLYLLDASVAKSIILAFELNPRYLIHLQKDEIKLFYVLLMVFSAFLGLMLAFYFYFRYGHLVDRTDLYRRSATAPWLNFILSCIFIPILTVSFAAGGYLLAIKLPAVFRIDLIAGFEILQILLSLKVGAFVAVGACGFGAVLLPYSMHPFRKQTKA